MPKWHNMTSGFSLAGHLEEVLAARYVYINRNSFTSTTTISPVNKYGVTTRTDTVRATHKYTTARGKQAVITITAQERMHTYMVKGKAASWTEWLLKGNPKIQEREFDDAVLIQDSGDQFDGSQLAKLENAYLNKVTAERDERAWLLKNRPTLEEYMAGNLPTLPKWIEAEG